MTAFQSAFSFFDATAFDKTNFVKSIENYTFTGEKTRCESGDVPYLYNEFWTAKQRASHSLHEISYRACFKAQLPEFFIERLTNKNEVVFDPFMGRGTTLIQASLMGRNAVGNDINPLSQMLCRPRINPPSITSIANRLNDIDWSFEEVGDHELLAFYHKNTLKEILALRNYLFLRAKTNELDSVDDWIRMVAINRLTGHSAGFFSVYSLPPNQAVSIESQVKINRKLDQTPSYRNVRNIILNKSKSLLKDGLPNSGNATFHVGLAEHTPNISSDSVDLIVTSPPFLDIVQYSKDNWLRCWFAGIDIDDVAVSMHKKPDEWREFVTRSFGEFARIVRSCGHVAFEVGEVNGGKIALDEIVLEAIKDLPFEPLAVLVNVQEFTKTANCWGVGNNSKGTNTNRIIVAKRK